MCYNLLKYANKRQGISQSIFKEIILKTSFLQLAKSQKLTELLHFFVDFFGVLGNKTNLSYKKITGNYASPGGALDLTRPHVDRPGGVWSHFSQFSRLDPCEPYTKIDKNP